MKTIKSMLKAAISCGGRSILRESARAMAIAVVGALALTANATVTNTWAVDSDGIWSNAANWASATVPSTTGDVAKLTYAITATRNVTIDTPITLAVLQVGGVNKVYSLKSTGGGTLTMNTGNSEYAIIEQMTGSTQNILNPACGFTLESDLDLINRISTYLNIGPFHGSHDIHVNRLGATGTPYINQISPNFTGNWTIYSGRLMFAGDPFGSTSLGTRMITLCNNAVLRDNAGSPLTLSANRRIVIGTGGGRLSLNNKTLVLNATNQLAGSATLSIDTENGTFVLGEANNSFTGSVVVGSGATVNVLKLGSNGGLANAPLINLANSTASLDVTDKAAGYNVPSGQVVAGVGSVRGKLNVSTAGAQVHPGSYTLPLPTPGILTITNGLTMASGGAYLWNLKSLKDNATGVAGTDFSKLNVSAGAVTLTGGVLTLNLTGTAASSGPDSGNAYWKTEHTWTILTGVAPPSGKLVVSNPTYTDGVFFTQVNGNTLELVYKRGLDTTIIIVR